MHRHSHRRTELEAAVGRRHVDCHRECARRAGLDVELDRVVPRRQRDNLVGAGNYDLAINTLEKALTGREYIAADHFTAADLFVGANVNFMLAFNLLEPREVFVDYARRMTDREL